METDSAEFMQFETIDVETIDGHFPCIEGPPGVGKFDHFLRSFRVEREQLDSDPKIVTSSAEKANAIMRAYDGISRTDIVYSAPRVMGDHGPWFVMEIDKIDDEVREQIRDCNIVLATRDTRGYGINGGEI